MKVTAIVEKGKDGLYSVYSDQEISNHCFGGYGESVDEAKADFMLSIDEAKKMVLEQGGELPAEAKDITVEFKYDIPSFFNCFDWINVSQFAKRAGINESQMRQYKSGLASASEATTNKILSTIKEIGSELQTVTM